LPEQQTDHEDEQFDRWSRKPALSTRGYFLAVLVPVLLAAAGFGMVTILDHTGDSGSGAAVRVPTSEWIPGQPGGDTRFQGALAADEHDCVYLETADQHQIWPIWPAGYTAKVDSQGVVTVYDGKNAVVAREGQQVQMTGSPTSARSYAGERCLPGDGDVAVIQSSVTVLG